MNAPRVTVLMSVYNGERYLREAMDSIIGQTFADFQFLIINDGSTDSSVEIIQSYADSRVRLIHNDANMGLTASLNKGLELSLGDYIARMDADDISRPERLALQVRFMDANPKVGVCGSWVQFISKENKSIWKLPEKTEDIRCWQFHTVGVAHPSVILRRSFFVDQGLCYDLRCRYAQDYELWGRAIKCMDFANIPKVLLDYRISSEQIGAIHGSEQLETVELLRLQRVRELGIDPTQGEQMIHGMIMDGSVLPGAADLDSTELWLLRLESANRHAGLYPTDCFSRRLLDIWFAFCIGSLDSTGCSIRRCLTSPLWSTVNLSIWHRARAFGAWLTQVGVWKTIRGRRCG